ncbi:hypothetical protein BLNAU_2630 [Blattamonas nauphoetae]|uniref:Uncharacterized protein n=1 Tax=Blattamonas nauphoetae TaxID=2049346 RepID=A0ABQ9YF34_9EUKA|nr:hypothetical protein BLNAU_2630 [Blattamonas nauphoetae]
MAEPTKSKPKIQSLEARLSKLEAENAFYRETMETFFLTFLQHFGKAPTRPQENTPIHTDTPNRAIHRTLVPDDGDDQEAPPVPVKRRSHTRPKPTSNSPGIIRTLLKDDLEADQTTIPRQSLPTTVGELITTQSIQQKVVLEHDDDDDEPEKSAEAESVPQDHDIRPFSPSEPEETIEKQKRTESHKLKKEKNREEHKEKKSKRKHKEEKKHRKTKSHQHGERDHDNDDHDREDRRLESNFDVPQY